jgi:hypothetical protein
MPEQSNGVWLVGAAESLPEVAYSHALEVEGLKETRGLFGGAHLLELFMEKADDSNLCGVIVEGQIWRKKPNPRVTDNEDMAPYVPQLLQRAGIEVPTVYVQTDPLINREHFADLGYSAIVAPTPDLEVRTTGAVRALLHVLGR